MRVPIIIRPETTKLWMPCQELSGPVTSRPISGATLGSFFAGNATDIIDGIAGKARYYDGVSDYSYLAYARGSGALSGFMWFRIKSGFEGTYRTLFNSQWGGNGFRIAFDKDWCTTGKRLIMFMYGPGGYSYNYTPINSLKADTWQFLGFSIPSNGTYSASKKDYIYIDGTYSGGVSNGIISIDTDIQGIQIMARYDGGEKTNADISHLWLGATELTEKEFRLIHNSTKGGFE